MIQVTVAETILVDLGLGLLPSPTLATHEQITTGSCGSQSIIHQMITNYNLLF